MPRSRATAATASSWWNSSPYRSPLGSWCPASVRASVPVRTGSKPASLMSRSAAGPPVVVGGVEDHHPVRPAAPGRGGLEARRQGVERLDPDRLGSLGGVDRGGGGFSEVEHPEPAAGPAELVGGVDDELAGQGARAADLLDGGVHHRPRHRDDHHLGLRRGRGRVAGGGADLSRQSGELVLVPGEADGHVVPGGGVQPGQRPDLDFTPVGVVTRLSRLRGYLDAELAGVFARYGLTSADFLVIVSLRRGGPPYRMPQARLMDALGLTSGTVSVRLDRLEKSGIVTRDPDPASARGSLVQLTGKGLELFDRVAPGAPGQRGPAAVRAVIRPNARSWPPARRLLSSFESGTTGVAACWGSAGARPASARPPAGGRAVRPRRAAGRRGGAGQPGHTAGIERGDLLISLDGAEVGQQHRPGPAAGEPARRRTVRAGLLRGNEDLTVRLTLPDPPDGSEPRISRMVVRRALA